MVTLLIIIIIINIINY